MVNSSSNDWIKSYFNESRNGLTDLPLNLRKTRLLYINLCLQFVTSKCEDYEKVAQLAFDHADGLITTNELKIYRELLQNYAKRLSRRAVNSKFHGTAQGDRLQQDCCGIRALVQCLYSRHTYPRDFFGNFWGHQSPEINSASLISRMTDLLIDLVPIQDSTHFRNDWRNATTMPLAQTLYDTRDFTAAPVLADALEDAGCNEAAILVHLRDPSGVHVRGCWAVDLVLGKS